MSKKYIPSGYQIINVVLPDEFTDKPTYDSDSLIGYNELIEWCHHPERKPLLLTIKDNANSIVTGYANYYCIAGDLSSQNITLSLLGDTDRIELLNIAIDFTVNPVEIGFKLITVPTGE